MSKPNFPTFLNIAKNDAGEGEINIFGNIGSSFWDEGFSKHDLVNALNDMGDVSRINVNISSFGGSLDDGVVIYDLLKNHKANVITNVYGFTASAATVIALAGKSRRMSENAMYLVHMPMVSAFGNVNEISVVAEELQKITDQLIDLYKKETGMTRAEVKKLIGENNGNGIWITAKEAKEKGLIDEIISGDKSNAVKNFSQTILNEYKLPDPMAKNQIDKPGEGIFAEIRGMFSQILDAIAPKPAADAEPVTDPVEPVEPVEPAENIEPATDPAQSEPQASSIITDEQLTAITSRIDIAEQVNAQIREENAQLEAQVADLNAQITSITAELTDANRAAGRSTRVGQTEGSEDGNFQNDPRIERWAKDLEMITKQMNNEGTPSPMGDDRNPEKDSE
jgi:ATP-dependent Clp protease, protease subunit